MGTLPRRHCQNGARGRAFPLARVGLFARKTLPRLSKNCTVSYLSGHYPILLLSVATLAVLVCVFYLIVPRLVKNKEDHGVYKYSLLISNYGYMGYALVEAVYGDQLLTLSTCDYGEDDGRFVVVAKRVQ